MAEGQSKKDKILLSNIGMGRARRFKETENKNWDNSHWQKTKKKRPMGLLRSIYCKAIDRVQSR